MQRPLGKGRKRSNRCMSASCISVSPDGLRPTIKRSPLSKRTTLSVKSMRRNCSAIGTSNPPCYSPRAIHPNKPGSGVPPSQMRLHHVKETSYINHHDPHRMDIFSILIFRTHPPGLSPTLVLQFGALHCLRIHSFGIASIYFKIIYTYFTASHL